VWEKMLSVKHLCCFLGFVESYNYLKSLLIKKPNFFCHYSVDNNKTLYYFWTMAMR